MSTLRGGTPALSPLAFAIILGQLLLPLPMLAQSYQPPSVQIGIKNSGTLYGNLSGYGSLNFSGCTASGAAPNFTITCNGGGGSTATSVQEAAEASTPVQSSVGLDTTYLQYYFVPGFTDNATTPNTLYTAMHYAIDDDSQNLYQLQYTNKAIAAIEKAQAGSYFVWFAAGDSDTAGISTVTQSVLVETTAMLEGLSGYPGWGYGGPGFLPVNTTKNTPPGGVIQTLSGTWTQCAWTAPILSNGHSGACLGIDNTDATDVSPTIGDYYKWQSSGASVFTDCFIYYAKQSGGGSFKSNLDGADGSTVSTNGTGIGSLACPHGSSTTHAIEAIVTTSGSPVTILGAIAINATNGTGVLVLKAGAAANTAAEFATNPNYSALMAKIQSDLSGLTNFATGITLFSQQWGANEWGNNYTPASMLTAMGTLDSAYAGSGANADYLIITDNDDANSGTTNSLGLTMWQYDYAHQQFANQNRYAFFSTLRRTYPARSALCGTLHLTTSTCQRMIATHLLAKMLGHTLNPLSIVGINSPNFIGTPTVNNLPVIFDNYDSGDITYTMPIANATQGCSTGVSMFTTGGQFECWVDVSQTAAYSGCGTAPTLSFALGWTDNYQNTAINSALATDNMFFTASNGVTWTTSNSPSMSMTSSAPGAGQVWTGVVKHIYNAVGGQAAYCPVLQNTWTTCTTAPTIKFRVKCRAE